jgi:uncharacterized cupin superfamily protein
MPKVFDAKSVPLQLRGSPIPEFDWHTSPRLAAIVGAKHMQLDIRSLDPGRFSFPYHFHRAAEEAFVILSGSATLRSPEGFRTLEAGELVFIEEGPAGAHQLYNHTGAPCVYVDIRTTTGIDVTEYPDTGKVNILPFMEVFEAGSKVDYFKGEENVAAKWPAELLRQNRR